MEDHDGGIRESLGGVLDSVLKLASAKMCRWQEIVNAQTSLVLSIRTKC